MSWQLAVITLIYTIIVDCIEGYVLSPRIIGRAVGGDQAGGVTTGDDCWVRIVWRLGAILAAPTVGLIQALVGAYWQYYQKTHAEEFPLQQLEEKANCLASLPGSFL